VRARPKCLTRNLGWPVRIGEEGEGGRRGAGRWGQPVRGRERGEARSAGGQEGRWAGVAAGPRGEERGEGRWAAGEEGPAQEDERRQAGLGWLGSLPSFFFFPFSFLYSNYSNKTI
jgi:hypothetical protein